MKILFIGPYRQNDGWGNQARAYIKSLNTTSHDIVIRPAYLGGRARQTENDSIITDLENKSDKDCDIVIQNALPSFFEYNGSFEKNIGLMLTETRGLDYLGWPQNMNLMDEIWVPSKQCVINIDPQLDSECFGNRTRVPVKNIRSPLDTDIFNHSHKKIEGIDTGLFNFYYIGELTNRKNLEALLIAFHAEFDSTEPVGLVIKTHRGNSDMSPHYSEELRKNVYETSESIKKTIRIYPQTGFYKKEIVITEWFSSEDMLSLHNTCDCFVFPSYGESCCRPALTAMGFGKTPIVTSNTGMTDFIDESTGWEIKSYEEISICGDAPLIGLYSGRETWRRVVIKDLMNKMREAYENKEAREKKSEEGMIRVHDHSYQKVGEIIEDVLTC